MTVIQHRRGTTAEWAASSYILEAGELGIEIDTSATPDTVLGVKVGNGESLWSALQYVGSGTLSNITSITTPNYITFDTTPTGVPATDGTLSWDTANETLMLDMPNVNLQIGQEHVVRVKNASTSVAIPDRTVVMFAGATGDTVKVSPAATSNVNTYPSDYLVGITTQEIAADGFGFVTQFGFINNVDTSAWTVGTLLYPDSSVAGGLTSTQPTGLAWKTPIAAVTKQNASAGRIFVRAIQGIQMSEVEGVSLSSLADKDLLVYESASSLWKNKSFSTLGLVTTSSLATSTTAGISKLFSDTVQTVAANTVTATASKTYGVQVNSSGQLVVNVPWTGTVTSASVVNANGFTGTVGTASTTPAITLKTTVDGILKGVSSTGVVSAATAGTDYLAPPSGTALLKANAGGALANAVAGTDYQAAITATGILKGAGAGSVSAAVAGTDYLVPSGSANISTSGTITSTATTVSSSTSTGAIVSSGGIGVAGNAYIGGDVIITGNVTVNGTTSTINSSTLSVNDKNIELGKVTTPTDITAEGGGITLKGATDKTFNWAAASTAWVSSENLSVATGKTFKINGTDVISSTTLGSTIVNSSLTKVGALSGGIAGFVKVDASGNLTADGNTYLTTAVTSVGGTGSVSGITLSGTVTTTGNLTLGGTLSVTPSNFASQTANTFLAAPNGSAGTPTFRTVAWADVSSLAGTTSTSFSAGNHTHAISAITNLQTTLDDKLSETPTALGATENLNDLILPGLFHQNANADADVATRNYPVAQAGMLYVMTGEGFVYQQYQTYGVSGANKLYHRGYYNTAWSTWRQVADTDGATFTGQISSTVASGTAPLSITSPTVVSNLAANYATRGAIYGTTVPTTASTSNMVKIYVSATAPTDMGTGDVWIGF